MAVAVALDSFLTLLQKSRLLTDAQLDAALKQVRKAGATSAAQAADALVAANVLTRYQANRLLEGRRRGLFIDEYKILEILGCGGMGYLYRGGTRDRLGGGPQGAGRPLSIRQGPLDPLSIGSRGGPEAQPPQHPANTSDSPYRGYLRRHSLHGHGIGQGSQPARIARNSPPHAVLASVVRRDLSGGHGVALRAPDGVGASRRETGKPAHPHRRNRQGVGLWLGDDRWQRSRVFAGHNPGPELPGHGGLHRPRTVARQPERGLSGGHL